MTSDRSADHKAGRNLPGPSSDDDSIEGLRAHLAALEAAIEATEARVERALVAGLVCASLATIALLVGVGLTIAAVR